MLKPNDLSINLTDHANDGHGTDTTDMSVLCHIHSHHRPTYISITKICSKDDCLRSKNKIQARKRLKRTLNKTSELKVLLEAAKQHLNDEK